MTPASPDAEVLGRRLRLLRDTLGELDALRGVTADELAADAIRRAATERLLQVVVDLAVDINAHIAVTINAAAPATARQSFPAAALAGALPAALADELAPSTGLRNVLVHRYTDIRVDLVADAVDPVLEGYARYVESVSAWLLDRSS